MKRPVLALLLATLVPVVSLSGCGSGAAAVPEAGEVSTITAPSLSAAIAAGEVTLIDVRTPEEFAEGHIAGAINLPVETFDPATVPVEDGKEPVFYCRSSRRSGVAASAYAKATHGDVRHLEGGILAWEDAELPVE